VAGRACGNTGYAGRLPIHEWMPVTKAVRDLILEKASADALRAAATADGYRSMRRAALEQVELGETSVEEMLRVTREQIDA
jgi:type II secretory ATPase GspE/PulE/Tfp pilus assembly ATPase PilB-like protein